MDLRTAILAAADVIESTPERYQFSRIFVPDVSDECSAGCFIGWVDHFMGRPAGETVGDSVLDRRGFGSMGVSDSEVYARMSEFSAEFSPWAPNPAESYTHDAATAAKCARAYADKYHPATASRVDDNGTGVV